MAFALYFSVVLPNILLALDQLMTQLMEGANSTRPVPATEEIMERLPREVLEEGSEFLIATYMLFFVLM